MTIFCVRLSSHHFNPPLKRIKIKREKVSVGTSKDLILLHSVNHELEVNGAATVSAIVLDVLGPSLAFNVDQDAS